MSCFRHYTLDAALPLRLRPESMEKLRCLRARVIRSLYHMYEPFAARVSRNPAIPESTPSTLRNSKVREHSCWALCGGWGFLEAGLWLPWWGGSGCRPEASRGGTSALQAWLPGAFSHAPHPLYRNLFLCTVHCPGLGGGDGSS